MNKLSSWLVGQPSIFLKISIHFWYLKAISKCEEKRAGVLGANATQPIKMAGWNCRRSAMTFFIFWSLEKAWCLRSGVWWARASAGHWASKVVGMVDGRRSALENAEKVGGLNLQHSAQLHTSFYTLWYWYNPWFLKKSRCLLNKHQDTR